MECVVVFCASEDQEAIAQSKCLRLTGTDIVQTQRDNATRVLASLYSSVIICNEVSYVI